MKHRWTIKELQKFSDRQMIEAALHERMSDLNPYSPLRLRLQKVIRNLYDAEKLLELILSQKDILPLLLGVDTELDKVIAERMK